MEDLIIKTLPFQAIPIKRVIFVKRRQKTDIVRADITALKVLRSTIINIKINSRLRHAKTRSILSNSRRVNLRLTKTLIKHAKQVNIKRQLIIHNNKLTNTGKIKVTNQTSQQSFQQDFYLGMTDQSLLPLLS